MLPLRDRNPTTHTPVVTVLLIVANIAVFLLVQRAGTLGPQIEKLSAALGRAVKRPEAIQRLTTLGMEPVGSTPDELAARMRADIARYTQAVKISGAKVE